MVTIITISLIILILAIRGLELYLFIRRVMKLCHKYDWKYIDKYGHPLVDVMNDPDGYFLKAKWSAYNFLFMGGPHPFRMFFSIKPLRLETQYNKEAIEKLKEYEII